MPTSRARLPALQLNLSLAGDAEVSQALLELGSGSKSFRPLMRSIGGILARSVRQTLRSNGRGGWPARKYDPPRSGRGHRIARQGGTLAQTIVSIPARRSVRVGTTDFHGRFFQRGVTAEVPALKAKPGKPLAISTANGVIFRTSAKAHQRIQPARPFLVVQPEDRAAILQATRTWIEQTFLRQARRLARR